MSMPPICNRTGWASTNASATAEIWRWNCTSASSPKGAAIDRNRATSANCAPSIDMPTNPSATENSTQKPRPPSTGPTTAKISGTTATATYSVIHPIPRTTTDTATSDRRAFRRARPALVPR